MSVVEKEVELNKDQYVVGALKVLNCFLKLRKPEYDLLLFMVQHRIFELDRDTRMFIKENYGRDRFSINNHISTLRKAGVLVDIFDPRGNRVVINDVILDVLNGTEFNLKLKVS
jgi:hypothetical protein